MSLAMFYFGCGLAAIIVVAIVLIQAKEDKGFWG